MHVLLFKLFVAAILAVLNEKDQVLAVSASAKRAERNFTLVAQTAEAANTKSPGLRCPTSMQYLVIGQYTNVDPNDLDKKTDALLFRDLRVEGRTCNSSNYASTATIFSAVKQSPGGTPVQTAQMFFLKGMDNSARRCGSYVADLPAFYYFTDNMPLFRTRLEDEQLIPRDNKALSNANKSDIYMIAQPFPPGRADGSVVSNAVCTYLADKPKAAGNDGENSTAENDDDDDSGSVCFPADAMVTVLRTPREPKGNRVPARMDELYIGMHVLSSTHDMFSEIYFFTHRSANKRSLFVILETLPTCGKSSDNQNATCTQQCEEQPNFIALTPQHFVHTYPRGLLRATDVQAGKDHLIRSQGDIALVISSRLELLRGLYAPHTLHGDIVVNGFLASTYTALVPVEIAHAALFPLRIMYRVTGWFVRGTFDDGFPRPIRRSALYVLGLLRSFLGETHLSLRRT